MSAETTTRRRLSLCQRQTAAGVVGEACWGLEAVGSAGWRPLQSRDATRSRGRQKSARLVGDECYRQEARM